MSTNENWDDEVEINAQSSETWDQSEPIIGQYLGTKHDVGPNKSQMHNIKTDDDVIVGVWGSTVLDDKIEEVEIGDRVRIEFLGKKATKSGRGEYKDYSVKVKRGEAPVASSEPVVVPDPLEGGTPADPESGIDIAPTPFDEPKK